MWAVKLLIYIASLMSGAIGIACLDTTQMHDDPNYSPFCAFVVNFDLKMVGSTDRCVGSVERHASCELYLLAERIDRIYSYIKAKENNTYEKACSASTVKGQCFANYDNLTVQTTDQTVPDPITGQQVPGCKWSGKEVPLTCNGGAPINSSAIKGLGRADIMPYFVINGAPIICDAPEPPLLAH